MENLSPEHVQTHLYWQMQRQISLHIVKNPHDFLVFRKNVVNES